MKKTNKLLLGINIDHVATLRQARNETYPCPVTAAKIALNAGADGITLHLREDRRHIQIYDLERIVKLVGKINLEMAATKEMLEIAIKNKPHDVCIVPEKRQELTTEGGLDLSYQTDWLRELITELNYNKIRVSLFIEPDFKQIEFAKKLNASFIELHTGLYANLYNKGLDYKSVLNKIKQATSFAHSLGLLVNAGHGLNYNNTTQIAKIEELVELNIGHAIVAEACFIGLTQAVKNMKNIISAARS